jgi:hypothetical protein
MPDFRICCATTSTQPYAFMVHTGITLFFSTCEIWASSILGCDAESLDDKFHAFQKFTASSLSAWPWRWRKWPNDASLWYTCFRQWRSTVGAKYNIGRQNLNNCTMKQLYHGKRLEQVTCTRKVLLLRMTKTMISQNIDLSPWGTLYIRNHLPTNTASHL